MTARGILPVCVLWGIEVNASHSLSHSQKQLNDAFRHVQDKWMCVSAVDVFPAAVQSSGQTPAAEMVHDSQRSWQEEDHKRRHANGAGPTAEVLQLPAVEGSEDRLQEVRGHLLITCASPFITMLSVTFQRWCCLPYNNLTRALTQVNDQPSSPKALWCVYSLSLHIKVS